MDKLPANQERLEVLTAEILILKRQTAANIIEIGRRLLEAKELVGHGNWLAYLRDRVQFSERTAQRFMRAAEEFGNTTALTDLEPAKVYALLELPAGEREEFLARHNVADMTVRQVEAAVDEWKRRAEEAERRAAEAEARVRELESRPAQVRVERVPVQVPVPDTRLQAEIERLRQALAEKDRTLEELRKDRSRVIKLLEETNRDLDRLRAQVDRDGSLEAQIRAKEQRLKELAELERRMAARFEEGRNPDGGQRLMEALQPLEAPLLKAISEVRILKAQGVGGPADDAWIREMADRLRQLAANLDAILKDRAQRPIDIPAVEVG